ncbi:MAG: beta-N-acetylhexosaminidase [Firmicutes bacterium]|nr:beta-N-acetylhexosaminidase [Bacillota bacterium]
MRPIFYFRGDIGPVAQGVEHLTRAGHFEVSEAGLPVQVVKTHDVALQIDKDGPGAILRYREPHHFFRGIGWLLQFAREPAPWHVREEPAFRTVGAMFDVSRNAVLTVASVQRLLEYLALMGLNLCMLYTEDVYTVAEYPYFGHLRGAYTPDEWRAMDEYAAALGIELVPCIQTLAHLRCFLRWPASQELRDLRDILLVGEEATYAFLHRAITAASASVRSRRIHLGMDEAALLGRGRYLDRAGYRPGLTLMLEHLARVMRIVDEAGLRPMMWSDMWFQLGSATHRRDDPEAQLPPEIQRQMPRQMDYVYWDYYHTEPEWYEAVLRRQQSWGLPTVFAGGISMWGGFGVNYGRTFRTLAAGLTACRRCGVQEVLATVWGDDGNESHHFSTLLGFQWLAELAYRPHVSSDDLAARFRACTGANARDVEDLTYIDEIPGIAAGNPHGRTPAKALLWQDPLLGFLDAHVQGLPLREHFLWLEGRLGSHQSQNGPLGTIFAVPTALAHVLALKSDLGVRLKAAYDADDRPALTQLVEDDLPELRRRVLALRAAHRSQWYATYKAFGWEVLDMRYGTLLARLDSAVDRIQAYLDHRVARLEELEAPRLPFGPSAEGETWPAVNMWSQVVTAGHLAEFDT